MSTEAATTPTPVRAPSVTTEAGGRRSTTAVAGLTARRAARSGALWGLMFGVFVASSALGYAASYKTAASRLVLARTFGRDAGVSALLGPAYRIDTAAGFTAWRTLTVIAVLGGVWGLLTSTRLLRGEEDAGRWELLLAGRTDRRRATIQGLAGLGVGLVAMWVVTAVLTVATGRSSDVRIAIGPALYFSLALVGGAAMFLAVGALASQLGSTRRQAAAYAGAALGVSYAVRLLADSGTGLAWLRWLSPIGWVEELQPLGAARPVALVPIVLLVLGLVGVTVHLAGRRDLGASVIPDRTNAEARTRLLSGPLGLTVRLTRAVMIGWAVGIAVMALVLGLIAKSAGSAIADSSGFQEALDRLGARGVGAETYLGISFLVVAVLLSMVAAGQVTAARAEEADGRLDHLVSRPVSRSRWLGARVAVAAGGVIVGGLLAGLGAWVGAATQSSGIGLATLIEAGLNVVPPALVVLGVGVATYGIWPRGAAIVTYGLVAWSLLVELVGGVVNANHWLLDTSVFHQMAPAPAADPNWTTSLGLLVVAVAAGLVGALAFTRRDQSGA